MQRALAFVGGVLSGGAIGTAVALFLSPQSGDAMRAGLRGRYQRALQAGREAAAQRRVELEAQLAALTSAEESAGRR
ncbi:MAG: YtxH domain-containing protein [Anaerolineae bacterium]|nr:YtxH domain-containing protein [Anaerolineae bacterium]